MDGLLALRSVLEAADTEDDEAAVNAACAGALSSLDEAIAALTVARRWEGEALAAVLLDRLWAIAAIVEAADLNPARRPEAVRERLAQSVEALMASSRGLDENRLHQEAILMAAKADIREELDRLKTLRRRRAGADRRGRGDRPAARFPGPGAGARGKHAVRQGQRRQSDRAGA